MVDEARLLGLLRRVTDDVAVLRARAAAADPADRERLDAVKYTLVTAVEGAIRGAQHLAASESWRVPATNADAFRVLAEHGVLGEPLAADLARAAGLRNLLVHRYADIDDERVVAALDGLDALDAYVDAVTTWAIVQRD